MLPEPPYYVVIFAAHRATNDGDASTTEPADAAGYQAAAARMEAIAATIPGYLGLEHARSDNGFGITNSYWADEAAIRAFRENLEHRAAQAEGKRSWYAGFTLRVARVERAYEWCREVGPVE